MPDAPQCRLPEPDVWVRVNDQPSVLCYPLQLVLIENLFLAPAFGPTVRIARHIVSRDSERNEMLLLAYACLQSANEYQAQSSRRRKRLLVRLVFAMVSDSDCIIAVFPGFHNSLGGRQFTVRVDRVYVKITPEHLVVAHAGKRMHRPPKCRLWFGFLRRRRLGRPGWAREKR